MQLKNLLEHPNSHPLHPLFYSKHSTKAPGTCIPRPTLQTTLFHALANKHPQFKAPYNIQLPSKSSTCSSSPHTVQNCHMLNLTPKNYIQQSVTGKHPLQTNTPQKLRLHGYKPPHSILQPTNIRISRHLTAPSKTQRPNLPTRDPPIQNPTTYPPHTRILNPVTTSTNSLLANIRFKANIPPIKASGTRM